MALLENKIAIVTGAGRGLGAAMARAFAREGAEVVVVDRDAAVADAVADEIKAAGDSATGEALDITNRKDVFAFGARITERYGTIDVLVNNAGISQRSLAIDSDFEVYRRIVEVDLLAPIALTQKLLPHLIEREASWVVNISSVAGKVGVPMRTGYCAAKHGLVGYGDSLRAECGVHGLNLLTVAPGSVRTDVSRNALDSGGLRRGVSDKAIEEGMEPDAVAARIVEALVKGEREIVIADGMEAGLPGLRAESPDQAFDLMDRLVRDGYAKRMA